MAVFPDLRATLEPVQWCLRLHPDFRNHPDKYFGSASVSMDVRHVASIRGLVSPCYSEEVSMEIKRVLAESIGATQIIWARRKDGRRYDGGADLTGVSS